MNHTPTPWTADGVFILSTNDRHVIDTLLIAKTVTSDMQHGSFDITDTETAGANAQHIVRCVNAYDELVAALDAALSMVELHTGNGAQTKAGAAFRWDHEKVASAGRAVLAKVQS